MKIYGCGEYNDDYGDCYSCGISFSVPPQDESLTDYKINIKEMEEVLSIGKNIKCGCEYETQWGKINRAHPPISILYQWDSDNETWTSKIQPELLEALTKKLN